MANWDPISPRQVATNLDRSPAAARGDVGLPWKLIATINDDAMAPRVVAGQQVVVDTTKTASDGDGVLVTDHAGDSHLRIYRDTHDGFFEALPLNPDFSGSTFDSKSATNFRVVGVAVSVRSPERLLDARGSAHSESMDALYIVHAWKVALFEAIEQGRPHSTFDCYGHLGRRARGVPQ